MDVPAAGPGPVKLRLQCPKCKGFHVDRDEWATTRVHRTHLCEHCGHLWRPYEFPTVGIDEDNPLLEGPGP